MKLLLDENLPHRLRFHLLPHDCFTVAFMGWGGLKNGVLLSAAAQAGFDAIVTNDRGIEYQQNAALLPVSIVILLTPDNQMPTIRALVPELMKALDALLPRTIVTIGTRQ